MNKQDRLNIDTKCINNNSLNSSQEIQEFLEGYEGYQHLFLIGFESDIGAQNCESRTGQELGPNNFRALIEQLQFPSSNSFYDVDLSSLKLAIKDCGNIKPVISDIEATHQKLESFIKQIRELSKDSIIVVIGGTDDLNYPALCGQSAYSEKLNLIRIDPSLDFEDKYRKQFDDLEPQFLEHHQSHFKMTLGNEIILEKLGEVLFYGIQGFKIDQDHLDQIQTKLGGKFQYIYFDRDIRKTMFDIQNQEQNQCKASNILMENRILKESQQIELIVNIDLTSIKAQNAPGVSEPCPAFGFNTQEIEDIAFNIGKQENLRIFTISEYNPAIEKFQTGNVLCSIYQHLLLGIGERLKNQGQVIVANEYEDIGQQELEQDYFMQQAGEHLQLQNFDFDPSLQDFK
ncbi:formimidoylglutamase [Stylonychia lemnae]|uniref:Formimidoylglutamase n=1 Tax=Stylonychia lemnae TaxID=5949 RepID=A0A077ZUU9_STYLE|nr:formimidoylglutamase [Stylonychia lemnae]|eukprot:CDW73674.1 formimidoylglutamase [Stylonychia lemnae]